jgi:hypothetical protein
MKKVHSGLAMRNRRGSCSTGIPHSQAAMHKALLSLASALIFQNFLRVTSVIGAFQTDKPQ